MNLKPFLESNGIKQVELATTLELDPSTVSLKLSGERPWFQEEVDLVLAFLGRRLNRTVTYEEAFNGKAA
jgi:hypothetical protein